MEPSELRCYQHLSLKHNSVGGDGLQQLAPALARLAGVKRLYLGQNGAPGSAEDALSARLPASVWEATDLHRDHERSRLRAARDG